MARLTRKNIKVFAGNATNNGVFGSLQAENPVTTTNVEQIQSLPAWSVGWNSATMTSEKLPPLEEFQGIQYVTTYQQAYLMQEGMPEWASTVTYYKGSLAKEVTSNGFRIYCSLTNDNTNNLLSDTSNWKKVMDSSDLYAYDSAVVHLAGTETITGAKTFTAQQQFASGQGIRFNTDNGSSEHYVMRSSGNPSVGVSMFLNNDTSKAAFNISPTKITIGSNTILPNSITPSASDDSTRIATTAWVNSVGNNVVHRTGTETIDGIKTFTSDPYIKNASPFLYLDDTAQTKGTAPSADVWGAVTFRDANGNLMGRCRQIYAADKSNKVELQVHKANSSSDTDSSTMGIKYPASGSAYGFAPNSDVNGSILTTVSKTKAQKGGFKLGNGLIVNWGSIADSGSNTNTTTTFSIPFTTSNYGIALQLEKGSVNPLIIDSRDATSFTWYRYSGGGNWKITWVAFGY